MATADGNVDQCRVGHGRALVLFLACHEVGNVDFGAENRQRGAFDMAQEGVSSRNTEIVVADGAMLELRQRLDLAWSAGWRIAGQW